MTEKDLQIARTLKERIVAAGVPLVDLRVFGSRARGDADEDSDMDVFVEVEERDRKMEDLIYHIAWEVGFECEMVISPLMLSRDDVENSPLRASPVVRNIAEEGTQI